MDVLTVVLFGLGGGISAEVLKWFRIREELHTGIPEYAKEWPLLAINIGASAPLILSALAAQSPPIGTGTVD